MSANPSAGKSPSYAAAAQTYDQAHGSARSRRRFARIEAPIIAQTRGAEAVLEIGVGTGRLLSQVRATRRVGVDASLEMLAQARKRAGLELVCADAHQLPFDAQSFDAVIAGKGVFRYLRGEDAFAECARVLRPGGKLGIHQYSASTWSLRSLLSKVPESGAAMHVDRPGDFTRAASDAGFVRVCAHLFRSVRFYPYALEIPRRFAGRWWSHIVLTAERSNV